MVDKNNLGESKYSRNQVNIPTADALTPNIGLRIVGYGFALMGLVWLGISPMQFIYGLLGFVCLLSVLYSTMRVMACFTKKPTPVKTNQEIVWPSYTVLIPLLDEAHMVENLMINLEQIDYPRDKLQIMMLCEAHDPATISTVKAHLRPPFELVIVPPGGPRTKPNALNYAMRTAVGEIITIYDAEDRTHPCQLKTAVIALNAHPEWAGVQAPLDYFNSHETLLTRQFTIEYAALFHVWIPFLSRLKLSFPMGGTSNHIRRSALRDTGGWDSYNVTEDADLSFRLAAHGWELGYIHPPTQEEAIRDIGPWIDQRSRWMKGFMQTWIAHMATPLTPAGWAGIARQITLQITIGMTLLAGFVHVPAILATLTVLGIGKLLGLSINVPAYFIGAMSMAYFINIMIGAIGIIRAKKPGLLWMVPFMPIYWLFLFLPTLIAIWELGQKPFYWNKTQHGVTTTELDTDIDPVT